MSVHFATLSIASKAKWACGASWAFFLSPKNKAPLPSMKLAQQPSRWASCHEYRFVRRYLERCPQAPLSLGQVDPLIRELVHYRDLIHTKTKEQSE